MTPDTFIRRRQDNWHQLETLLNRRNGGGADNFTEADVRALDSLYRSAVADLALAQRDFPYHAVTTYLNGLIGKSHHLVYRGGAIGPRQIKRFFLVDVPRIVRRNARYVIAAHLLFYGVALVSYLMVLTNPQWAYTILPEATPALTMVEEEGRLWIDIPPEEQALAGAEIMTNNIQVTFLAFAGGMLAGLFTLYVLVTNGLMLGTIFAFVQSYGLGGELGEFVIGHGPVELSVICLAGAAGLRFGHAMVAPGLQRRRDAVAAAGRDAIAIAIIGALWLVLAGTIEGFISPSEVIPWFVKVAVGVVTGWLFWLYFLLFGRGQAEGD